MDTHVLSRVGFSGRRLARDPLNVVADAVSVRTVSTASFIDGIVRQVWRDIWHQARRRKPQEAHPTTYGEHRVFIARQRRCRCSGTCASCDHIARDTWRG